jgi:hypothetical protein
MTTRNIKFFLGATLLFVIVGGIYWKYRPHGKPLGEVFVCEQNVILWNTTAQVRQRVAEAHWGDQLETITKSGTMVKVRTLAGVEGWVEGRTLLDSAAWQREAHLQTQAKSLPVQATGRTKVFTNLRIEAGREAQRIYQLPGGVHVAIVGHTAAAAPPAPKGSNPSATKDDAPRHEDWLLVIVVPNKAAVQSQPAQTQPLQPPQSGPSPTANDGQATNPSPSGPANLVTGNSPSQSSLDSSGARAIPPVAGWVLGRFIELDLPQTLRDYATSAGMRPVAWFVLNHVGDSSGEKPQYLVAGVQGAEGQSCDFSLIRVYTWGTARHRYETAYVESDFCGYFPITTNKLTGKGDPEFRFTALTGREPKQERVYAMHQTTVRRVREPAPPKSR